MVSPNGIGVADFLHSIQNGISGIRHDSELERLKFSCQISGKPPLTKEIISKYFSELDLRNFNSTGIMYGVIAGMEAWFDAGLSIAEKDFPDWDSGTIFGTGTSGIEKFRESIYKIDNFETRKLGSTAVAQTMNSGVSAYLGGKLGLGNCVTTNSSACTTGAESILLAFERIQNGKAKRILAGSTSDSGAYIWGGFDALRVCTYKHNDSPQNGSRPMSETASGFVPSSGSGALVLESLDSALTRNATIYCEVLGGNSNSGGQRGLGSMTAPNPDAVIKCIQDALLNAKCKPEEIDTINGHLTATSKDALEIENWRKALRLNKDNFPPINSLKSQIGHALSASGSLESVASVLQIKHDFIFPNINCSDLHPDIETLISSKNVPTEKIERQITTVIKASFGFGDVNACVVFRKFKN